MALLTTAFFLLVLIRYAASISFNLPNISPTSNYMFLCSKGAYVSDEGLQVTPENRREDSIKFAGRATYVEPLHLWDKTSEELASFDTEFSFVIDSNGSSEFADGLTFFLAENNSLVTAGGALGLPVDDTNYTMMYPFIAVEFDTFWRNNWDIPNIPDKHVGIDVNNLTAVTSKLWLNDIQGGTENRALINYDSLSNNLSVLVSNDEYGVIKLSYTVDLRNVLPEWVIFGFSAATGQQFEKNNVKSWNFNSSILQVDEVKTVPPTTSLPPTTSQPPTTRQPIATSQPTVTSDNNSTLSKTKFKTKIVVGLLAGALFVVLVLAIFASFLWRKKNRGEKVEEDAFVIEMNKDFEMGTGPKRFSYRELVQATDGFVESNKLGEGGFGGVYKGFLKDQGMYVAVKRLSKTSVQGNKEYASEVKIISRLGHKNLVELKGWCHEKGELMLVYEFMENGSLDLHLFNGKSLLTWSTRYKIAHGLASALVYLHHEWEKCVLHRDIKSSNLMLDSNFNAKLGDFGLAKLVDHEKGSHTTKLAGTLGYMAPECAMTGKASKESDVYSFGAVALEIACGRKPFECTAPEGQIWLKEWVWKLYGTGTLLEAVDPRLGLDFEEAEIRCLMTVGLWCVHPDSELRPSMRHVIQVLNSEASLPTLPSTMPVASYLAPSV